MPVNECRVNKNLWVGACASWGSGDADRLMAQRRGRFLRRSDGHWFGTRDGKQIRGACAQHPAPSRAARLERFPFFKTFFLTFVLPFTFKKQNNKMETNCKTECADVGSDHDRPSPKWLATFFLILCFLKRNLLSKPFFEEWKDRNPLWRTDYVLRHSPRNLLLLPCIGKIASNCN